MLIYSRIVFNLENHGSLDHAHIQKQTQLNLKVEEKFYKAWRMFDLIASVLSIVGLFIAIYAV